MDEINGILGRGGYPAKPEEETQQNETQDFRQEIPAAEEDSAAPAAAQSTEAPPAVDYSVASGARETVIRRPTMAYNSSERAEASQSAAASGLAFDFTAPQEQEVSGADEEGPKAGRFRKKGPKKPMSAGAKRILAGALAVILWEAQA